jgi:hypothetical protein
MKNPAQGYLIFGLLLMVIWITLFPWLAEARWSLTPRLYVEGEYDDNIFLTERNEQEDFITTISPGINLNYQTPTATITLDYEYRRSFYDDFPELDFSAHRGRAEAHKDFTQWFAAGIRETFIWSQDPIELTGIEEFESPSIRTGRRSRYMRNIVEPEVTFLFGENRSIRLGYRNNILRNKAEDIADQDRHAGNALLAFRFNINNGIEVFYEHIIQEYKETTPPTIDRDFDGDEIRGRYTYYFDPKTAAFIDYQYYQRNFETTASGDYKIHNPTAGFSREIFENVTVTASAGYAVRDAEGREDEGTFSGTGDISGDLSPYQRLRLSLLGSAGFGEDYTSAEPLGLNEFWRAGFNATYQPFRRLWLGGFFYIERERYVDLDRADTLWSARGNVALEIFRWLFLSFEYVHSARDSNVSGEGYRDNRYLGRLMTQYDVAEFFR